MITVFDAILTMTSQFAMHLSYEMECIKFAQGSPLITLEINVEHVRHCEVFQMDGCPFLKRYLSKYPALTNAALIIFQH
jgi:hypothetical protein